MHYQSLAISDPQELTFGLAPKPVTTLSGMVIGGGTVYPELNFTLPPMAKSALACLPPTPAIITTLPPCARKCGQAARVNRTAPCSFSA